LGGPFYFKKKGGEKSMELKDLIRGRGVFGVCLDIFKKVPDGAELINAIAIGDTEPKRSQIERVMISAVGFGFMAGICAGTDEAMKDRFSELKEKMRELGMLPPAPS
jgi:hypothetical protein